MSAAPTFEEAPETERGRMVYEALLAVHAHIRSGLASVERLAGADVHELSADELDEELDTLKESSVFVRLHHRAEDASFFGELEEANPAIAPVVERLRGEHQEVADHLDAVERAARALTDDDSLDARRAVAHALEALERHLLAHLEYEERAVAATARRLQEFSDRRLAVVGSGQDRR